MPAHLSARTSCLRVKTMAESSIAWFGLIGVIVGAVPAMIGAVVPWLRDRDRIATVNLDDGTIVESKFWPRR